MAGEIKLTGLVSDINWNKLIEDIITARKAYLIVPYQNAKARIEDRFSAIREVNVRLSETLNYIKTKRLQLKEGYDLKTYTLRSSEPALSPDSLLGVTLKEGAAIGTYEVRVLRLAQAEKVASDPLPAKDQGLSFSGTIILNGKAIDIEANDSLLNIASKINRANLGVSAKVISLNDGDHRLTLESLREGAQGISFEDPNGILRNLGVLDELGNKKNVIRAGQNSVVEIDGFQVESQSNTLTDIIPGMTLQLKGESQSAKIVVSVRTDNKGIAENVSGLISRINGLLNFIGNQNRSDASRRPLSGEANLISLKNNIISASYREVQENAQFKTLSSIGITFGKDGVMHLDSSKFSDALSTNSAEVVNVLTKFGKALEDELNFLINPQTGTLIRIEDSIESQISKIDQRVKEIEKRLEREREMLEKKYSALELLISRSKLLRSWMENQVKAMFKRD